MRKHRRDRTEIACSLAAGAEHFTNRLARCLKDDRGNALIEFAIMMPLLVFVFLALMDYTFVLQQAMIVTDAATNGTRYAEASGNGTNVAGMLTAAQTTANGIPNFTATASNFCTCPPGNTVISCIGATCASGNNPAEYAQVATSASVPLFFKVTGIPATIALSASSTMRVSWSSP